MARQRGVTLKQIAERAGCSVTAVSKTLNGARGTAAVSEETQKRVWGIAREMGYTPNYMARALQSGRTNSVGLVSPTEDTSLHHSHYWSRIFTGVQRQLHQDSQDLVIVGPDQGADELRRGIGHLLQRRVDALIVPVTLYQDALPDLEAIEAPLVYTDSTRAGRHPSVTSDMLPGLRAGLAHLAELGHRRVIWTPLTNGSEPKDLTRHEAMLSEAQALGLTLTTWPIDVSSLPDRAVVAPAVALACEQFAARLVGGLPGTAVVAYSERAALGILSALQASGRVVPRDVSLLSFDDFYAEFALPALTVVTGNLVTVGHRSVDMALSLVDGRLSAEDAVGHVEVVASSLIVRDSTGPAPRA